MIDWTPVRGRIAREVRRGVAAFARRHADQRVTQVAIDATPHDDFFALGFDTAAHPLVGNFTHAMFHEFSAGVLARKPKDGWPAKRRGSDDGFVEAAMRGVLTSTLRELADDGAFARLPTAKTLRVGYCYHDSEFIVCRVVRVAHPVEPRVTRRSRARLPRVASPEECETFFADRKTAFDRATPYFDSAAAGSKQDQHSARNIMYHLMGLVEDGERADPRWKARAMAAKADPSLSGYAADLLAAMRNRRG